MGHKMMVSVLQNGATAGAIITPQRDVNITVRSMRQEKSGLMLSCFVEEMA